MSAQDPSPYGLAIATGILGLVCGYFVGSGSSIGLFSTSTGNPTVRSGDKKSSWPNSYDVTVHPDSSDDELMEKLGLPKKSEKGEETPNSDADDEEEDDDAPISSFEGNTEEVKLIFAVRTDLGMTKGKIAAQCSHATLACYKSLMQAPTGQKLLKRWEARGQTKVALQCKSEDDLVTFQAQAQSLGLCAKVIHDAGRTQIAAGSATVLGILGPKSVVDQVTGSLKLL